MRTVRWTFAGIAGLVAAKLLWLHAFDVGATAMQCVDIVVITEALHDDVEACRDARWHFDNDPLTIALRRRG